MDVQAITKFARMSPKKIRPLAEALRGLPAQRATAQLKYHRSKSAQLLAKVISSALANAKNNYNLKEDNLKIKRLTVDAGPTHKRYWFRSRGGSDRLLKRTAHLTAVLTEIKPTVVKKVVTKPEPKAASADDTAKPVDTSTITSAPYPTDSGKRSGAKRGLGRIFTPRTTNK